jgi:hypothetical protein
MQLKDRVETQEQIEKLTEEQRDDYFTKLIMGKDVTDEVETSRGKFEIKYPIAADFVAIGKIAAFRRNYKPVDAFDLETEMLITMLSTLDIVVLSGPPWFEKAKREIKNFSFSEVPSRVFISELYGKAYSFRKEVELLIDSPEESTNKRISTDPGIDEAVGGGAFGNLSSEQINSTPE